MYTCRVCLLLTRIYPCIHTYTKHIRVYAYAHISMHTYLHKTHKCTDFLFLSPIPAPPTSALKAKSFEYEREL